MEILNETVILMLSKSVNESYARVATAAFFSQLDPTVGELADIKTAVSEAVTNSIIHGYGDNVGPVEISLRIFSDRTVEISVKDTGKGIENIEMARQPLFTTGNPEERSGMGFTVMESFMDSLKVVSEKGEGTRVIMRKKLEPRGGLN